MPSDFFDDKILNHEKKSKNCEKSFDMVLDKTKIYANI